MWNISISSSWLKWYKNTCRGQANDVFNLVLAWGFQVTTFGRNKQKQNFRKQDKPSNVVSWALNQKRTGFIHAQFLYFPVSQLVAALCQRQQGALVPPCRLTGILSDQESWDSRGNPAKARVLINFCWPSPSAFRNRAAWLQKQHTSLIRGI